MPHSPQEFYKEMDIKPHGGENGSIKRLNRRKGMQGEKLAAKFLKRGGYKIISRNFKCPLGEVDIIARKGDIVAFVEVKARSTHSFGTPCEAVDRRRMARYINAARYFFAGRDMDSTVRFDIIEVEGKNINHIISAFEAN